MPYHYHVAFVWHAISFPLSAFLICPCHTAWPLSWYCTTVMLLYHRYWCAMVMWLFQSCCLPVSCYSAMHCHASCRYSACWPLSDYFSIVRYFMSFPHTRIFYNYKCYNHSRSCSWHATLHRYLYHNGHSKDGHSFLWCVKSPTLWEDSSVNSNYVSYGFDYPLMDTFIYLVSI